MKQEAQTFWKPGHLQPSTEEPLSSWWRMEIPHPLGLRGTPNAASLFKQDVRSATELAGQLTVGYNVRKLYELARDKHDPLLAPHGFFRALKNGDNLQALEFLENFGPLKIILRQRQGTESMIVKLDEFWGLHRRFSLICGLWESLDDPRKLSEAWGEVSKHHGEASSREDPPMGAIPILYSIGDTKWQPVPLPWEHAGQPFDQWLNTATHSIMREKALLLVHRELNLHARHRSFGWERGWEPSWRKFRPVIQVDSLWSVIWELFGLDTAGLFWRRCPHCQQFFYPKRKDQFYCTPRQQALASKREYARRLRAERKKEARKKHATKHTGRSVGRNSGRSDG